MTETVIVIAMVVFEMQQSLDQVLLGGLPSVIWISIRMGNVFGTAALSGVF